MHSAPDDLDEAVAAVRGHTEQAPEVALILGSGLGALAEAAADTTFVPAADIPGYPESTVEGHEGRLVVGTLEGTSVVFVQGRVHLYEGYPVERLVFPVRLVHALGAEQMVVTNSAGGINRTFRPGTLMLITDHLNLAFASPDGDEKRAAENPPGPCYDPAWTDRAEERALDLGLDVRRGVYAWARGPSYETPAEIRALERLGADAIGMSTVPEAIQAWRLGMAVVGLSTITNPAAGISDEKLDHDDVLAVGERVRDELAELVREIVRVG
ncbi:MAG: purine-nucleoside phosphorylase [Bacteroidetes bacterium SW_9_63_38]|nr:MAG: purine-nucleoside phosphorylase [Bacteroidetes bacterium SW_9_63_38]